MTDEKDKATKSHNKNVMFLKAFRIMSLRSV